MADPNFFAQEAGGVRRQGYGAVVPLPRGTKAPRLAAWSRWSFTPQTEDELALLIRRNPEPGTGLGMVAGNGWAALDIDMLYEDAAARSLAIAESVLGKTTLLRIGREPKCMAFWNGEAVRSRKNPFALNIEIFGGARGAGGQVVAYARHPDTGALYNWPRWHPRDIPRDDLPEINEDRLDDALAEMDADPVITRFGKRVGLPGGVRVGLSGVDLALVKRIADASPLRPIEALAAFIATADPATRHVSAQAVVRLVCGWRLGESEERSALEMFEHAFRQAKPEAAPDEFARLVQWSASKMRGLRVPDLEAALGIAP